MDIQLGIIFAVLSAVSWALCDYFSMSTVRKYSVPVIFFLMHLVGFLIFSAITLFCYGIPQMSLEDMVLMAVCGIGNAVAYLAYFMGLRSGKLSIIAPISACWVIPVAIVGVFVFKDSISAFAALGIATAIIGAILASFRLKDILSVNLSNAYAGAGFAAISITGWAVSFSILSVLVSRLGFLVPIMFMMLFSMFPALVYLIRSKPGILGVKADYSIIGLGILEALGYLAYNIALTLSYTTIVVTISSLYPVFALVLAWIFLKERLEINQYVGIALALLGIFLISLP